MLQRGAFRYFGPSCFRARDSRVSGENGGVIAFYDRNAAGLAAVYEGLSLLPINDHEEANA